MICDLKERKVIRRKLAEFMRGRYGSTGIDKLNGVLFISGFLIYFISLFFRGSIVYYVLTGIQFGLYVYFIFRLLSRNFYARQKENRAFCNFWSRAKSFFKLQKDRIKDFKNYKYKKCPECKVVLRLPRKKGEHTVKCPKCGERFNVNNIF